MNNSIKIGDLVKVVFVEGWRKVGKPLPGLTDGDIGRVTAIVDRDNKRRATADCLDEISRIKP